MSPGALTLPLLSVGAAASLHVDRLPWWCSVALGLALLWRWRWPGTELPRLVRLGLTILLVLVVLLAFRTVNGLSAGTALLACMAAMKLLETRTPRDIAVLLGVALVLVLAACLDRQDLWRLPLCAAALWLLLAAFAVRATPAGAPPLAWQAALRRSGRTLLLGLPLALAAFLLFPRIPASLWTLPADNSATTGLGSEMSPGSIAALYLSEEVAFRVRFEGPAPGPADRYWRGPVLHDFDGTTWRQRPLQVQEPMVPRPAGTPITQMITLEPTQQPWWFALETIVSSPQADVRLTWDQQLLARRPVTQALSYTVASHPAVQWPAELPRWLRFLDLRLPADRNPRSMALARALRADSSSDQDFVRRVLLHFRDSGLRYTLAPETLGRDAVDDLLFSTREGFCGHFASAFTVLMRAGGVPARVVTGYQGGDWNDTGGYLVVRQSDAHAWVEVWLEGRGWQRVDPTAMVQPDRLQRAARELLPAVGGMQGWWYSDPALRSLWNAWDAGNQWWRQQAMGLRLADQLAWLRALGFQRPDHRPLVAGLGIAGLGWLGWLLWQLRREGPVPPPAATDPVAAAWQQLRGALLASGVTAADGHQGPLALGASAAGYWPDLREPLQAAVDGYLQLRFAPPAGDRPTTAAAWQEGIKGLVRTLRQRAALQRLPPAAEAARVLLRSRLPLWSRLPPALALRTAALAAQWQQRMRFEGCNGLVVTEEMRWLIGFQACLLVSHRGLAPYAGLRAVLVYPDAFVVRQHFEDEAGVVTEGDDVLSGQTVDTSRILLSWTDIEDGLLHDDGYNVVVHEFAHLLDHELGGELSRREGGADSPWHDVFEAEYAALCAAVDAGEDTVVDPYGSEDPVEFFAVCTEAFIGLPRLLEARHPRLYAQLRRFYGLDPARWSPGPADDAPAP
ncbi:MAG: hypothetical protein RL026_190 [Pseudomonadota bacterium]|jgi:Mlc titration factor MtfA (ptsG expression regulator)/transglutaminase-like putative cysteine protease